MQKYTLIKVTRNGIDITDQIHIEHPDGLNVNMAEIFGTIDTYDNLPAIRISDTYVDNTRAAIVDDSGTLKLVVAIKDSQASAIPTLPIMQGDINDNL